MWVLVCDTDSHFNSSPDMLSRCFKHLGLLSCLSENRLTLPGLKCMTNSARQNSQLIKWAQIRNSQWCLVSFIAFLTPLAFIRGVWVPQITCVCVESSLTLCDPVDCSPPGSSVHGILQARILEWVAISYSRGILPTWGSNLCLLCALHWQVGFFFFFNHLCHLGSPK